MKFYGAERIDNPAKRYIIKADLTTGNVKVKEFPGKAVRDRWIAENPVNRWAMPAGEHARWAVKLTDFYLYAQAEKEASRLNVLKGYGITPLNSPGGPLTIHDKAQAGEAILEYIEENGGLLPGQIWIEKNTPYQGTGAKTLLLDMAEKHLEETHDMDIYRVKSPQTDAVMVDLFKIGVQFENGSLDKEEDDFC